MNSQMRGGRPSDFASPGGGIGVPATIAGSGGGGGGKSKRPNLGKFVNLPSTPKNAAIFAVDGVTLHSDNTKVTISTQTVYLPNGEQTTPEDLKKLEEIGRGNYGAVYRYIHEASGSVMAIKVS